MDLQQKFSEANIPLVIEKKPLFGSRSEAMNVFQMSIDKKHVKRGKPKEEYFRLFLGSLDNEVNVLDIDRELRQIVLTVHEPRRTFRIKTYDPEIGKEVYRTRTTPDWKRFYLLGLDSTHMFISELPKGASTIKEAHDRLKPLSIKGKKKVKRQGEWFFIPVTSSEQMIIDENNDTIQLKGILPGNTKNRHTVDELIEIEDKIFARGKIRHREHKTMQLLEWYRVARNTERVSSTSRISWID